MVSSAAPRNSREDVIRAAGRLFAERGYHGTSMRDLGAELGLFGSSIYSHVGSKQELLVEVVATGAQLFQESAARAERVDGGAEDRLRALISGHLNVVLGNLDEVRTFLNEASALEPEYREQVIAARDRYEESFRHVLKDGVDQGVFHPGVDPKLGAIFILSILNAVERWFRPGGELDRARLAEEVFAFVRSGTG
jgi:TetR/AcrR family transcriptional regulator, cholesterol catabolism regulator